MARADDIRNGADAFLNSLISLQTVMENRFRAGELNQLLQRFVQRCIALNINCDYMETMLDHLGQEIQNNRHHFNPPQ